ncbi:MAG: glycosyltransferase family 2 protein [Saprospiraceae bacterium]|nr:glycosyltransferase family 2 protein [Saprospiraceae bacterium]MBP8892675.1 glycosyltransferase family 2 protein [Saprospiraceae bacterium]HQW70592.1 glycosyltransferase family A protein [Saprospiraceae bacterium]
MNITVLIITRNRIKLLQRAITSVKKQCFSGNIKTLICIDDCPSTLLFLKESFGSDQTVSWFYSKRLKDDISGPSRLAHLRNFSVEYADTEWISFLDDDNELELFHYSELMRCASINKSEAVHCYRQLFFADGVPYCFMEEEYPWGRNSEQAKEMFKNLSKHGVIEKGCHVIRDQIDVSKGGINIVDTNVWLIKRETLLKNKIPSAYTKEDWLNIVCEDDKMLDQLIEGGVRMHCNNVPSVKYYLGGYSNAHYLRDNTSQKVHAEEWKE